MGTLHSSSIYLVSVNTRQDLQFPIVCQVPDSTSPMQADSLLNVNRHIEGIEPGASAGSRRLCSCPSIV